MQDMLAKRVREWTQQWQEEGAQQGLAAERTVLLRQARKRFGEACTQSIGNSNGLFHRPPLAPAQRRPFSRRPPLGSAPPWSALGSPCLREPSHAASVRQRLASSVGRQQATGRLARLTAAAGRPDRQDGL